MYDNILIIPQLNKIQEKAAAFRDWFLLNKYFAEGFIKFHKQIVREKEFIKGQSLIKQKVNTFINCLKDNSTKLEEQYQTGHFPKAEISYDNNYSALRNITNTENVINSGHVSERSYQELFKNSRLITSVEDKIKPLSNAANIETSAFASDDQERSLDPNIMYKAEMSSVDQSFGPMHIHPEKPELDASYELHPDLNEDPKEINEDTEEEEKDLLNNELEFQRFAQDDTRERGRDNIRTSQSPDASENNGGRYSNSNRKASAPKKQTNGVLIKIEQRAKERKDKALEIKRK